MPADNENFWQFCDVVARGRLVVLTGAGVTQGLLREVGGKMPNWPNLLQELRGDIPDVRHIDVSEKRREDEQLDLLIKTANYDHLIEAASILQARNPSEFHNEVIRKTTPKIRRKRDFNKRYPPPLLKKILDLDPLGIITFNYDSAHEDALKATGNIKNWRIFSYDDEDVGDIISEDDKRPFLLKAHGSIAKKKGKGAPILSGPDYRQLLQGRTSYSAVLEHLLTSCNFLMVGFGLKDLDFNDVLATIDRTYGKPVRAHFAFEREPDAGNDQARADHVVLSRRYGIRFLYWKQPKDIEKKVAVATQRIGPETREMIDLCLSPITEERSRAHKKLIQLGKVGKAQVASDFRTKIERELAKRATSRGPAKLNSKCEEWIYSLGVLGDGSPETVTLLKRVATESENIEEIAHALTHLANVLTPKDRSFIKKCKRHLARFEPTALVSAPDQPRRLVVYTEYMERRLLAKYMDLPAIRDEIFAENVAPSGLRGKPNRAGP